MTKELVDYHCYEIWSYEDNSVDIHISTDVGQLDYREAVTMSEVIARNLKEELRESRIVFSTQIFADGSTSVSWRGEEDEATTYRRFLWVKRSLHTGTHGSVVPQPRLPLWMINMLSTMEYVLCRICAMYLRMRGREAFEDLATSQRSRTRWQPASGLDELSEGSEITSTGPGGNVVPFTPRSRP